ncbi:glycoside hydrolase family 32 protein [Saccharibacter sp. 17.LH.SD]|uniref:glycoside hydrolase family 32 protein n=1 Tax=Saccharibacter sp. 17.LH.SD TaxID=2689393 RepID=UPI00136CF9A3|nr:glycoside hydrolase family 32 protein [Saccharibacter sp. 17.LH.SD]MXV45188.1 glycoside hydrolase family 32 protein [Saccharibacter sp. 17.LH.SD]
MSINRRTALGSFLAAGALLARAQGATTHQDSAPEQPNNSHSEPGNNPNVASGPVAATQQDIMYRPSIHFTPPSGFMNDPNGLIFDGYYYHLYYQYNPFAPYAGHVHWGHAVSTDLYHWQDMPIAIRETEAGEAYSGCAILDRDNVSGLFPPRKPAKPRSEETKTAAQKVTQELSSALGKKQDDTIMAVEQEILGKGRDSSSEDFLGVSDSLLSNPVSPETASSPLSHMAGGLVALYTRATPHRQTQYVAWSPDGGQHFIDYAKNPVLDIGHNSFRDPKVLWHAPTEKWVMVVVRARDHKVSFYGSFDLLHWMHLSDFGPAGVFGVDYECPALVELPVDGGTSDETRWVLFVSVNPGGPQGGSITQYFVGHFDGERFEPEDTVVGLTDFAKDSYALQTYENMPGGVKTYFAWLNNWQYCEEVPNKKWRGTMTIPRQITLRRDEAGWLRLVQNPYKLEMLRERQIPFRITRLLPQESAQVAIPTFQAIELFVDASIEDRGSALPDGDQGRSGRFVIVFSNRQGESLSIGFDAFSSQLWLDRSSLHGFAHPFFTGSFSSPLVPGSRRFTLRVVLDASTLEIFANDGMSVGTALVYPSHPLEVVDIQVTNAAATLHHLALYVLKPTMNRS